MVPGQGEENTAARGRFIVIIDLNIQQGLMLY